MKTYLIYQDRVYSCHGGTSTEYFYGEHVKLATLRLDCWLSNYDSWQLVTAPTASLAYRYAYLLKICEKSKFLQDRAKSQNEFVQSILHKRGRVPYCPDWVTELRKECGGSDRQDLHASKLLATPLVCAYRYLEGLDEAPELAMTFEPVKAKPVKSKSTKSKPKPPKIDPNAPLKWKLIKLPDNYDL